jgi:predicted peptidase
MKRPIILILALFAISCSGGGGRENDFPTREAAPNGNPFKYRIFIPKNRDPNMKIPVMLYLHGSGARGNDNREQLDGFPEWIAEHPERFTFAIVFPQCPEKTFWTAPQIEKALAALDRTVVEINGDEKRMYLAGYSMGGFGVWQTAIANPEKFAALISVAGGVEALGVVSAGDRSLLSEQVKTAEASGDVHRAYAGVLKNVPAWLVHGDNDDSVPVDQSRKLFAALKNTGNKDANYFELAGADHAIIERTFQDEKLFEWLRQKSK